MFAIDACFWNTDIYIRKKKYAANEILTAYLNSGHLPDAKQYLDALKSLKTKLILSDTMDYDWNRNYAKNIQNLFSVLHNISSWLTSLPPYDCQIQNPLADLEDTFMNYLPTFEEDSYSKNLVPKQVLPGLDDSEIDEGEDFYSWLMSYTPQAPELFTEYGPEIFQWLTEYNQKLTKILDSFISFLQSYMTVKNIFSPFITEYLNQGTTYPQPEEVARAFQEFSEKSRFQFSTVPCKMESFRYKVITDDSGIPMLCEDIHFSDLQSFLFYDFFRGIRYNYFPNRCKRCGRFFLNCGGKHFSYCDGPVETEPGKTCRDIGAKESYGDKCKNDPIWQAYNRAYKAHYARRMKKKMSPEEFENWSRYASSFRDQALAGEVDTETFCKEIKK